MCTVPLDDEVLLARLRERLTDVRFYSLDNEYTGVPADSDTAWQALHNAPGARLIVVNALLGIYKVVLDDHRWYLLRPSVEFEPQPAAGPSEAPMTA
ncbi:hypothetical protein ACFVV7_35610 [Streptomyces globisporus]|uniref:hypothetical protein n=1 Tax=Streptomyces globisporus TaxID=1908 RepID=UPI0036DB34D3